MRRCPRRCCCRLVGKFHFQWGLRKYTSNNNSSSSSSSCSFNQTPGFFFNFTLSLSFSPSFLFLYADAQKKKLKKLKEFLLKSVSSGYCDVVAVSPVCVCVSLVGVWQLCVSATRNTSCVPPSASTRPPFAGCSDTATATATTTSRFWLLTSSTSSSSSLSTSTSTLGLDF